MIKEPKNASSRTEEIAILTKISMRLKDTEINQIEIRTSIENLSSKCIIGLESIRNLAVQLEDNLKTEIRI